MLPQFSTPRIRVHVFVALLLAIGLLWPAAAPGKDVAFRGWGARTVRVIDATDASWQPFVREAVAQFNAQRPPGAPLLRHETGSPRDCYEKKAIVLCLAPAADLAPAVGKATHGLTRRGTFMDATVFFADSVTPGVTLACHELFHAYTAAKHGAWVDVHPCPYDAQIVRDLYERPDKRRHHR